METDKDAVAPGSVAIAGVIAICHALAESNLLNRQDVEKISNFMAASIAKSGASDPLQQALRTAVADHFALVLRKFEPDS